MEKLTKDDLAQMNRPYFESLNHESLVNAACNLRDLGVELIERLEQNSRNSSRPPSSDNPYDKGDEKAPTSKGGDENSTSSKGNHSLPPLCFHRNNGGNNAFSSEGNSLSNISPRILIPKTACFDDTQQCGICTTAFVCSSAKADPT